MEIKIRNIDENIVRKIDDISRKKGLSRNMFLKHQIELIAQSPELIAKDEKYERLVREVKGVVEENTRVLSILVDDIK